MPGARRATQSRLANPARLYDYLLGGQNYTAVDKAAAESLIRANPYVRANVQANRRLLARMIRYLARHGITQFLDIGTGLPGTDNTHQIAQRADPAAKVVYVDNDPLVGTYARALLTRSADGAVDYVHADLADPRRILAEATRTLSLDRPLAIILLGILFAIPAENDPYGIVATLAGVLPPGSYLAISHPASDIHPQESARGAARYRKATGIPLTTRSKDEVGRFFDGFQLVDPGIVPINQWRPDDDEDPAASISAWAGLGFRP